jgi:predicted nuclease of predicted toxin-antitoxin system
MRFLIDESADARLATHLHALGHDATLVAVSHRPGLPDPDVLAIAHREQRILITDDRDFGELVFRQRQPHAGVIYLRLSTTLLPMRIARLDYVLSHHGDQLDQFLVVTDQRVRVRPGPPGIQDEEPDQA